MRLHAEKDSVKRSGYFIVYYFRGGDFELIENRSTICIVALV